MHDLPGDRLEAAIADAAEWLATGDFRLVIDDSKLEPHFHGRLEQPGWERRDTNVYLCHVGNSPPDRQDVALCRVGPDDAEMAEWVRRQALSFADTHWMADIADAGDIDVEAGIRLRRLQEGDGAEIMLVDLAGAPPGIAAWYSGPDRLVFNLAVLPEQRGRGVGAALMARAIAGAERSTLINTDEEQGPVDLYRRWGFNDEVYCRIAYRRRGA